MRYALAVTLAVGLQMSAMAQEPMLRAEMDLGEAAPAPVAAAPKLTFKQAHPKAYKMFRKVRHYCILVQPLIDTAGSVAQVVLIFI